MSLIVTGASVVLSRSTFNLSLLHSLLHSRIAWSSNNNNKWLLCGRRARIIKQWRKRHILAESKVRANQVRLDSNHSYSNFGFELQSLNCSLLIASGHFDSRRIDNGELVYLATLNLIVLLVCLVKRRTWNEAAERTKEWFEKRVVIELARFESLCIVALSAKRQRFLVSSIRPTSLTCEFTKLSTTKILNEIQERKSNLEVKLSYLDYFQDLQQRQRQRKQTSSIFKRVKFSSIQCLN